MHHRPRIDRLADHAESLPVVGVHKNSLGPEAHSHPGRHHIEELETDTLVVRKFAGHKVADRNPGVDRDAGLVE